MRLLKRFFVVFCLMWVFLLTCTSGGYSCIIDPLAMGIRAGGMGSAMVAIADDLISALNYNPAGLSQVEGTNVSMEGVYMDVPARYESPNGYDQTNTLIPLIPIFGCSTDRISPVVLGLSLYSTLGVGFEFRDYPVRDIFGTITRYVDIKNQTGVLYLSPAVAYQINSRLSVGLKLNIGYGKSEMDMPIPGIPGILPNGGCLKRDNDGFGYGATIGFLYKPTPPLRIGFNWQSPMKTSLEGHAHLDGIKDDLDFDIYWPQMLTLGIGYKPKANLILGLSLKWADWSYFDRSKSKFKTLTFFNGPLAQDTKDEVRLQVGVEYLPTENLALRCGYIYRPRSIRSEWITPLVPDSTVQDITIGMGVKFGNFQIDTVLDYTIVSDIKSSHTFYPGEYKGKALSAGFGVSYHFR